MFFGFIGTYIMVTVETFCCRVRFLHNIVFWSVLNFNIYQWRSTASAIVWHTATSVQHSERNRILTALYNAFICYINILTWSGSYTISRYRCYYNKPFVNIIFWLCIYWVQIKTTNEKNKKWTNFYAILITAKTSRRV